MLKLHAQEFERLQKGGRDKNSVLCVGDIVSTNDKAKVSVHKSKTILTLQLIL